MTASPPQDISLPMLEKGLHALKKNRLAEAEACFAQAISINEQNVAAWSKLGETWFRMEKTREALDALTMADTLSPDTADILYTLGLVHLKLDHQENGLSCLEHSFRLAQSLDLAVSLGDLYFSLGDYQKSAYYYLSAYKEKKSDDQLQYRLSIALYRNGDVDQALGLLAPLVIRYPDNKNYIFSFTDFFRSFSIHVFNPDAKKAIEICLKQDRLKFLNLRTAWSNLLMLDPDFEHLRDFAKQTDEKRHTDISLKDISKPLGSFSLCAGLTRSMASGIPLENILTSLRKYFLLNRKDAESWSNDVLKFLAALAVQCWFNDYVYFLSAEEKNALADLQKEVTGFLSAPEKKLPDHEAALLALYCCFEPLYSVYDRDDKLPFSKQALYILKPPILHQLTNPRTEAALVPSIKSLTEIEDTTSLAVQKMYEQRPYPRWTSMNEEIVSNESRLLGKGIEILVAGCGTGQEVAFYASALPEAHITAVDLSRTSLAYAIRQANELGFLSRVDFLHGDLMDVGKLGKNFDFIASSGVLHHLKEPDKGLAAIRACLKSGGRMSLSLYSKTARDYMLNPALDYIREKGYSASIDDMRQFRRDLFTMTMDNPVLRCITAADFYNLAECNDMLFHVQEHRITLKDFEAFGARHGLAPLHIRITPEKYRLFQEEFPDKDIMDFDALTSFEANHPGLFMEMYKIYFRPADNPAPHPLDPMLRSGSL